MRWFFFPIFNWLHRQGLLSTKGTVWDYFVVATVAITTALPLILTLRSLALWLK